MSTILHPEKRDLLYPEGFGFVIKPAKKISRSKELFDLLQRNSASMVHHGLVLIERAHVTEDVSWEIMNDEKLFSVTTRGLSGQLLHAHGTDHILTAPDANSTPTVFTDRETQREFM